MTLPLPPSELLRQRIGRGIVVAAGAFNPFVARLAEEAGFDAIYVSGAALANSLARPDEGLTSRRQVLDFTQSVTSVVDAPVIVDVDTGFGGPKATAQTMRLFERAGAAAIQVEDQDLAFKRCGHLEGKQLISPQRMAAKVSAAREARSDAGPLLIARTDARAVEGMDASIERSLRYIEAGADIIFPEALQSPEEFRLFRRAVQVPLVANMTEFGKSPWLTDSEFAELGYNIVLHPVSAFRFMAKSVREALLEIKAAGYQKPLVDDGKLMTRAEIDRHLRPG